MKKLIKFIALLIAIIALTGCYGSKGDVKLYDSDKALEYVEDNFGKAIANGVEKESEDGEVSYITYYFLDKEYGFEYYLRCYPVKAGIDATSLGWMQGKKCNFKEAYLDYINEKIEPDIRDIEHKYGFYIKDLFTVEVVKTDRVEEGVTELAKAIRHIDNREFLHIEDICVYKNINDDPRDWIAKYDLYEGYITKEEAEAQDK